MYRKAKVEPRIIPDKDGSLMFVLIMFAVAIILGMYSLATGFIHGDFKLATWGCGASVVISAAARLLKTPTVLIPFAVSILASMFMSNVLVAALFGLCFFMAPVVATNIIVWLLEILVARLLQKTVVTPEL